MTRQDGQFGDRRYRQINNDPSRHPKKMKEKVARSLDPKLLENARTMAKEDRRTLDGYIAYILARQAVGRDKVVFSVTAPDNVRSFVPAVFEGDDEALEKKTTAVLDAILTASGR